MEDDFFENIFILERGKLLYVFHQLYYIPFKFHFLKIMANRLQWFGEVNLYLLLC